MKLVLKFVIYSVIIVALTIGTLLLFKDHPEVQLAFLIPGIFITIFSRILDEIYLANHIRMRMLAAKER